MNVGSLQIVSKYLKKKNFFLVENIEFSDVDYCCTLCMISTNYSEALNSQDSKRWILAMKKDFGSLVENNFFEWQKAPKNKNIISSS